MSETQTHSRGDNTSAHPITGEAPGIKEILERRAAGEVASEAPTEERERPDSTAEDEAARVAQEMAQLRQRATTAEQNAAAESRARQQAEQDRARAVQGAEDTGFTAITTALAAAQRESESLKAEMKAAGEAADFGRVAEISVQLGQLGADIRELDRGRTQYEHQRETRLNTPPPRPEPTGDPTERSIMSQLGFPSRDAFLASRTPATRAFLQENPQFFTDAAAFKKISAADNLATLRDVTRDTPEYFDMIRKEANLSQSAAPPRRETSPTPGAAPSRDAPGPAGRQNVREGDIYVTAEQKAAASWMGVDPVDYARNEAELRQRGEIPYRRR